MNILFLIVSSVLILRSGDRIEVSGPIREESGVIYFRVKDGSMYSIPLREVDERATADAAAPKPPTPPIVVTPPRPEEPKRRKVTAEEREKLLRDLEKNHGGTPAPPEQHQIPAPPPPTKADVEETKRAESQWRREARAHREAIRRATEERDLLLDRADRLRSEISSFLSLGYKPSQFTYQTTQLQHTLDQLPYAELEIKRAERAWDTFRDDARKEDVPPGWLRD